MLRSPWLYVSSMPRYVRLVKVQRECSVCDFQSAEPFSRQARQGKKDQGVREHRSRQFHREAGFPPSAGEEPKPLSLAARSWFRFASQSTPQTLRITITKSAAMNTLIQRPSWPSARGNWRSRGCVVEGSITSRAYEAGSSEANKISARQFLKIKKLESGELGFNSSWFLVGRFLVHVQAKLERRLQLRCARRRTVPKRRHSGLNARRNQIFPTGKWWNYELL